MSKYRQNEVDLIKALEAKTPVSEQVKQARAKAVRQLDEQLKEQGDEFN